MREKGRIGRERERGQIPTARRRKRDEHEHENEHEARRITGRIREELKRHTTPYTISTSHILCRYSVTLFL